MLAKLATGNRLRTWWALQRQQHRRQAGGATPLVITSLDQLSGLLVEFRAESSSMTFSDTDILTWSSVEGSEPMTLAYFGDGDGNPSLMLNALGTGNTAVYFRGGKMTADVGWSFADLTSIFVGNLDLPNLSGAWVPRWVSVANYGLGAEDWASPDTWVVGCYDTLVSALVADRNGARPLASYFDASKNYIVVSRKMAGTISAWVRPFGEATATASGATVNAGLSVDTFTLGGNMEPQNLYGMIGHVGLWNRALTDTEVLVAMNYLGTLYE